MLRGLYTAYKGMSAQMDAMNVVSNNLANIDTNGYKQDNAIYNSFKSVYAIKLKDREMLADQRIGKMTLGNDVGQIYTNYSQSGLKETQSPLDLAIEGQGMFVVGKRQNDGTYKEYYTRDGSLTLNSNNELVTKNGEYLLGQNGIIRLEKGEIFVNEDGSLGVNDQIIDKIRLVSFNDNNRLKKIGNNLYTKTKGLQIEEFKGRLVQGFLETSNVNSVDEMVEMMTIMRAYEASQKVLATYDTTLEGAVSLGRV